MSAYNEPLTKEKLKKFNNGFINRTNMVFSINIAMAILVEPYKKFGYYKREAVYNLNIFIVDAEHMKIPHEIDAVKYEKVIWYHTTRYFMQELCFYYLLDDPNYIIGAEQRA